MTPKQFCDEHDACEQGRDWALSTGCQTMRELWDHPSLKPEWAVWVATRTGVLSDRDTRRFAVWCCRQVQHLMTDPRSVFAVDVAERFATGLATEAELRSASAAARAARAASDASAAAWSASDAASAAAWSASDAWSAARDAASAAASAAARDARDAQHQQVRTYNLNLD